MVPYHFNVWCVKHFFLHGLGGAKLVPAVHHIYLVAKLCKVGGFFCSCIASAYDRNILSFVTVPLNMIGLLKIRSAAADGWTGAFMHAWQPEFIDRHYPYQKEKRTVPDEGYWPEDLISDQIAIPFFAIYAAEMGDDALRDTLVEWGDRLPTYHRTEAITIRLHDVGEGCRRLELDDPAPAGGRRRRGDA